MKPISRVLLNDIAGLRAKGLSPGQIAREIGANIDTITEAIKRIDRRVSPKRAKPTALPQQPPGRDVADRLGKHDAAQPALSRVEFLDRFDLNVDDIRDGHNATALWHIYLDSRARARGY
ncbi:hypothetical protein ACIA8R_35075 [Nonomuraea sp. NPDC051191]|uniref:hypothetical protein n=1 Tax=Nonomuraea sp. NPDC051191 TaxID=3364372 RepID=UPI003787E860